MEEVHSWVDQAAMEQRTQKMAIAKTSTGEADMKQLTNQLGELILRMGRLEQAVLSLQCLQKSETESPQLVSSDLTAEELEEPRASFFILAKADGKLSVAPAIYKGGFYDPRDGSPIEYHMVRTDKPTEQGPKILKPLSEIFRSSSEAELALGARISSSPKTGPKSSKNLRRVSFRR